MKNIHLNIRTLSLALLLQVIFYLQAYPQHLPHSIPEKEGVDSKGILDFVNATRTSKTEFHSFMLVRHGKVVADGWWNPYGPELRHTLYSCSKSFTATAIGFAINEQKLALDSKVISFFPDQVPATISPNLAQLTVRDALIMADGQDPEPGYVSADTNWVKGFLAAPVVHKPGSVFLYNSLGTYMLSAIIQKVTGQTVLQYLTPRLFKPLGIKNIDWETDLKGISTGGWGLRLKTEDMAKFAQLFLQKGKWEGKQILPLGWAEEASTAKIIQHPDMPKEKRDASDWEQGYGYQMWRSKNNAYRGDGAFGQYMIVMPDQDAVIAITAETADMQEEIDLVWKYLLPAMHPDKLPENKLAAAQLKKTLKELALPPLSKQMNGIAAEIDGKSFTLASDQSKISNISFKFSGNGNCQISLKGDTADYSLSFGAGNWLSGLTNKPGPSLTARAKEIRNMLVPAKVFGSYSWIDDHRLALTLRYIESPHTEKFICEFAGDSITVRQTNSVEKG
ncbi:MAG TPA: serine hydrolase, partial [Pedobacter sp.]|nr:serine hydrolase [Pedobacter sp.]